MELPNAYGQPGVTALYPDVLAEDAEGAWLAEEGRDAARAGDPCVVLETFMCETALSPDAAERLAVQLKRTATRARRMR